ncbi:hypothetical protein BC830DRAFT_1173919 [Chytriomyces sp. MP71]|nr:hypothetical protein BC830DRAFT_1173919 [Chytriomyces sp. MP71]
MVRTRVQVVEQMWMNLARVTDLLVFVSWGSQLSRVLLMEDGFGCGWTVDQCLKVDGLASRVMAAYICVSYDLLVKEQNGACQSLVTGGAEKLGFTIFGAPFYQAAYTAYDKTNNRIGFAQLKGSVPNPPIPSTTAVPPAPTTSTKAPRVSTTIAPKCNHDECSVGAFLHAGCSKCADEVCAQDSYCCNNKWDDSCVNEVNQYCSTKSC